jgi:hypothetical protein
LPRSVVSRLAITQGFQDAQHFTPRRERAPFGPFIPVHGAHEFEFFTGIIDLAACRCPRLIDSLTSDTTLGKIRGK